MKEATCKDCRSWEEEMYWNHFQCRHFSQLLQPGFDKRLAIPKKYSSNLKGKLPNVATLKGPSGTEWKVRVTTNDGTLFFNQGWQEFVEENFLQENDFLVFQSNGEGCFKVLMFDGQSMCEKEAAYFVRKCGHKEYNSQKEREASENSAEIVGDSSGNVIGGFQQRKLRPRDIAKVRSYQRMLSRVARKANLRRARRKFSLTRPAGARQSARNKITSAQTEGTMRAKLDDPHVSRTSLSFKPVQLEENLSCRRLVTEEQKANALQLAEAALTHEGFLVVMKPTHVTKRFFMTIPAGWMAKHLRIPETEDVILHVNELKWRTRLLYTRECCGGLSYGWKNFVADNKLQEFDVCVFEPGIVANNSIVLYVKIFRAFEEAITSIAPAAAVKES